MVTAKIRDSGVDGLIQCLNDFDPYSIDYHTALQVCGADDWALLLCL